MFRKYLFFVLPMFVLALFLITGWAVSTRLDQRIETERTACDSLHDSSLKADACAEYHKLVAVRKELPPDLAL